MRKTIILIMLAILLFSTACSNKDEKTNHSAESVNVPSPRILIVPIYGDRIFSYEDTSYRAVNETEFYAGRKSYDPETGEESFDVKKKSDPATVSHSKRNNKEYYTIDGVEYIAIINPDPDNVPFCDYYEWTYDRRFFYEYAITEDGGRLYSNINSNSGEAYIYSPVPGTELLLVKPDSPIADYRKLSLEDFSLVVLNNIGFDDAEYYRSILDAHLSGIETKKVNFEALYNIPFAKIFMTFECKRIPGLRYTIEVFETESSMFVHCRKNNSLAAFDPGYNFEDLFARYESVSYDNLSGKE